MPRLLPGTSPETDLYALTDDELSLGRPAVEVAKALLDSGIKILIAVVIGALLLGGLYALFGDTILPTLTEKVEDMFNFAG